MGLRKFKPTTPGQRHKINSDFSDITASKPEKSLLFGKKKSGGRNNDGRMTMRYIGGGHKQRYRFVDFIVLLLLSFIVIIDCVIVFYY
jgi:large subunit ribosomal protein L2